MIARPAIGQLPDVPRVIVLSRATWLEQHP
jgi:hypothetical protein